jgi:hypothetical protein
MNTFRGRLRPRFIERSFLTLFKLAAELCVAAYILVTLSPRDSTGLGPLPEFADALSLVLLYGAVFGYIPLCLLLAILWGALPRNWRPYFPTGQLLVSLAVLLLGAVLFSEVEETKPVFMGMAFTAAVIWFLYSITTRQRPGP